MKINFKRILCCLSILIFIFNCTVPNIVFSTNSVSDPMSEVSGVDQGALQQQEEMAENVVGKTFGVLLDGIVGLGTVGAKVLLVLTGSAGQVIATMLATSAGTKDDGDIKGLVTPSHILFNKIYLTDVNFFDTSAPSPIKELREGVSTWYYVLRTVAIIVLLCILIYVGIRMATSTVAEQKVIYKKMLFDWLVSFVLIFVLQYIMIATINVSNGFVDILNSARGGLEDKELLFESIAGGLVKQSLLHVRATIGFGSAIVYLSLIAVTFGFLLMYVKRMITIGFLIIISPIITITYAIDKMGDQKSQALNTWLKEFVYNILIQPFHCIIYLVFVTAAIGQLNGTLASMVLAIMMMFFIFQSEKIIRKIFGFEKASSLGEGIKSMTAAYGGFKAIQKLTGTAKSAASATSASKSGGGNSEAAVGTEKDSSNDMPKVKNSNQKPLSNNKVVGAAQKAGRGISKGIDSAQSKIEKGKQGLSNLDKKVSQVPILGALYKANKVTASPNIVGGIVGATFAGAAGGFDDIAGIVGGGVVGSSIGKGIGSKTNNVVNKAQVTRGERVMATAYNNVVNSRTARGENVDDTTMDNITQVYMDADDEYINAITDTDEKLYAKSVRAMKGTYRKAGVSNPNQSIEKAIEKVRSGELKPNQF